MIGPKTFRGVFGPNIKPDTPGTLEFTAEGEAYLQLSRWLGEDLFDRESVPIIYGEIDKAPEGKSCVTLLNCLGVGRGWGTGGLHERWFAHQVLLGTAFAGADESFNQISIGIRELAAFLESTPDPMAQLPPPLESRASDWDVALGWKRQEEHESRAARFEVSPFVRITSATPVTLREMLSKVSPVFEGILSLALRRYPMIESLHLVSSDGAQFRLLSNRLDRTVREKDSYPHELLFRLRDVPSIDALVQGARNLFVASPFGEVFLGYERAPPTFLDDRVRGSIMVLMQLLREGSGETASERPLGFGPPRFLEDLPKWVTDAVTEPVAVVLGTSGPDLAQRMILGYRWSTYREGDRIEGRQMLRLHHQLRAVAHLRILEALGFSAEQRIGLLSRVVKARGV